MAMQKGDSGEQLEEYASWTLQPLFPPFDVSLLTYLAKCVIRRVCVCVCVSRAKIFAMHSWERNDPKWPAYVDRKKKSIPTSKVQKYKGNTHV